jgi:hypothetical protein
MTCRKMVKEFQVANGHVVEGRNNGPEVAVLRSRLIIEEFAETYAALHENNVIEVADGLTDLLYVVVGAAVAYGEPHHDAFVEPLSKPAEQFDRADILRFGRLLLPRIQRACLAMATAPNDCGESLSDLAVEICRAGARTWGFPMQELFAEVHRSNMTKTFATNTTGGKYGSVNPKGPGYTPPDIAGTLRAAYDRFVKV